VERPSKKKYLFKEKNAHCIESDESSFKDENHWRGGEKVNPSKGIPLLSERTDRKLASEGRISMKSLDLSLLEVTVHRRWKRALQ